MCVNLLLAMHKYYQHAAWQPKIRQFIDLLTKQISEREKYYCRNSLKEKC